MLLIDHFLGQNMEIIFLINPIGDRFDGLGHQKQADPKAQVPHAYRVDENGNKILDGTGNPYLPVYFPNW